MAFDPSLATGFEHIDEQHRLFLDMLGELCARIEAGQHRQGLLDALQGAGAYAASHFADEEALMTEWEYPDLAPHARLHETFRRMVGDLEARAGGGPGIVSLEMLEFLGEWFIGHIRNEDQRFAVFARASRDRPSSA
jgi:hemerythrin-like metal-binding protein